MQTDIDSNSDVESAPHIIEINIELVRFDSRSLDWSLTSVETSLSLADNEWK